MKHIKHYYYVISLTVFSLLVGIFIISKLIPDSNAGQSVTNYNTNITTSCDDTDTNTALPENDITEKVPETPANIPPVDTTVTFLAAGDNLIHQNIIDYAKVLADENGSDTEYYFDPLYDNVRDIISSYDIAFVNQEGPIAGEELRGYTGYPTFNAPDEVGTALVNAGFDIVNIANNHMLDRGEKGYINSINFWKNQPVTLIGGYESREDFDTIRYIDCEGVKIALLSYTYGTNGIYLPQNSKMWVPYYFEEDFIDRHSKEARLNADIVIVVMHWGSEHSFSPNKTQKQYCDLLVNNNVDVIIGIHPHVLQPIEWKMRPDGKKTLVAYSIGNFLSSMRFPKNMVGGLFTFDIDYSDRDNIIITNPGLIPTMCYYSRNKDIVGLYKFTDFPAGLYETHGSRLNEDVDFETVKSYITNTIAPEYLPVGFLQEINNS
ncbi:MAG: CapA family protein [Clostridia bacterium]|nr:CapA family protein [Clostridia bacterium]